mmetsp:Transcript_7821/g.20193  ORF Transcript_7821/g.20193 Transcript_7821/m.20193 type:complete len:260 (+) Transcript_7821:466-1245(+)
MEDHGRAADHLAVLQRLRHHLTSGLVVFDLCGKLRLRVGNHHHTVELLLRDLNNLGCDGCVRGALDHVNEFLPEGIEVNVLIHGFRDGALLPVTLQGVLLWHDLDLSLGHVRQRRGESRVDRSDGAFVHHPRPICHADVVLHAQRAAHKLQEHVTACLALRLLLLVHPAAPCLNNRCLFDPHVLAVNNGASPRVNAVDAIAPAVPVLVEPRPIQDHPDREVVGPVLLHVAGLEHELRHGVHRVPHLIQELLQEGVGVHL